jgi:hypothetical protein
MKFIYALILHAWLAIRLKHNGDGMPTQIPSAAALVGLYALFTLAEKNLQQGITLETIIGLTFITQCYIFNLRNKVVGLIIMIGIITNATSIALISLFGITEQQLYLVTLMEYVMIFFGIINVIKSNVRVY